MALPAEHGGWGLLLAPIALGLALAPTAAGALLGLAAIGAFLARHPLKIALADGRRSVRYPRTLWAERFALGYGLVGVAAFVIALRLASSAVWAALLVQFGSDLRNQQRKLWPELAGAVDRLVDWLVGRRGVLLGAAETIQVVHRQPRHRTLPRHVAIGGAQAFQQTQLQRIGRREVDMPAFAGVMSIAAAGIGQHEGQPQPGAGAGDDT